MLFRSERSGAGRCLSAAQWVWVEAARRRAQDKQPTRDVAAAVTWFYATGLRLGELLAARCGDLIEEADVGAAQNGSREWTLRVTAVGKRTRRVPVSGGLVAGLENALAAGGRVPDVRDASNDMTPLLYRLPSASNRTAWTSSGLAKALKQFFREVAADCASGGGRSDAESIGHASAYWLRHTHALHSLHGGAVLTTLPLHEIRRRLGHAALRTTRRYRAVACSTGPLQMHCGRTDVSAMPIPSKPDL